MTSTHFAGLVTLPVVVDAPGLYLTRIGEQVRVDRASNRHDFACLGEYQCGTLERWHKSGRLFVGLECNNDIVAKDGA